MPDSGSLSGKSKNITYRESDNEEAFRNTMIKAVSIGRALTCLRSDIQQQLKAAKEDLNLEYVRIRDIFSDSLFFYFEDADKNPVFNWVAIDTIFDFFRSIDVRPYIELGYTPAPLASKKQYAAWQYHPNVSMPKSYPAWANLITRFFEHIIERYGLEEVRKWYFEFWTNPNLKLEKGYWYESREEFFRFYAVTYFAVKSVDSQLILGSPNFSYPAGLGWYENFLVFAKENGIKPDFISHHAYSIGDGQSEKNESILNLNAENVYHALAPEKEYLAMQIRALREISESRGFGDLDIIISDWNVSYLPQDYSRDTCFMAAFMLHSFTRAMGQVKCLCVWSLSDIHEEFFYHDTMFHGGPGLIDYAGIPKASYYALSFVGSLSKEIIRAEDNYILTKNGAGYQLILYNMAFYDSAYRTPDLSAITYSQRYNIYDDVRTMNFHIALKIEPGQYNITERIINRESGSSYDIWQKMGRPEKIMGHLADYLKSKCIPDVYMETIAADPELVLDISVEPHGVTYISIQPVK
ncbi:MAG: hypothetical protein HUJ75_08635 [Parasporobacterium sp.]|nr:hypothetical protein [Parasporobacterium sp.]